VPWLSASPGDLEGRPAALAHFALARGPHRLRRSILEPSAPAQYDPATAEKVTSAGGFVQHSLAGNTDHHEVTEVLAEKIKSAITAQLPPLFLCRPDHWRWFGKMRSNVNRLFCFVIWAGRLSRNPPRHAVDRDAGKNPF
jgi:hypothetical protein